MEAEELIGSSVTIDSIMSKMRDIKNKINEDCTDELSLSKICADHTGEFFLCLKKQTKT
jgi:serine/threonine-protein kinase TTK/MPS1